MALVDWHKLLAEAIDDFDGLTSVIVWSGMTILAD